MHKIIPGQHIKFLYKVFPGHTTRMNHTHLGITKSDYIKLLRNRNVSVSDDIPMIILLNTVKYLRKNDFRYLARLGKVPTTDNMSNSDIVKAIYTDLYRKKQNAIRKRLTKSRLNNFVTRRNISTADLNEIIRLNKMSLATLLKIAKLRVL